MQSFVNNKIRPLADFLRPESFEKMKGLSNIDPELLKILMSKEGSLPSLILWGPPGCGKTTLARIIGNTFNCSFVPFSAVLGGVKEIREIVDRAKNYNGLTILFIDEIHRFNKSQQDALLPHVEDGTIALIGATTENPSFSVNSARLSRCRVVKLEAVGEDELREIRDNALEYLKITLDDESRRLFASSSLGDARKLLNLIESFSKTKKNSLDDVKSFLKNAISFIYDKQGDEHYNLISAFIKSLRGSSPSGALYWGFRILESGEDPRFLIRRMIVFSSEDIGNADPRALEISVATLTAFEKIGMPEAREVIAHCITYLASAPKSNRSYLAMHKAIDAVKKYPNEKVPLHLVNAPTKLMKELGYSKGYNYPHDFPKGYVPDEQYLPDRLKNEEFYEPSNRGYEKTIRERFLWLKEEKWEMHQKLLRYFKNIVLAVLLVQLRALFLKCLVFFAPLSFFQSGFKKNYNT